MNIYRVTKACSVSSPGLITIQFAVNDLVQPYSPYYWPLRWSDNAVDTGLQEPTTEDPVFVYSEVVISDTDPQLGNEGLWIQTFPNSDDYTIWIEEN